MATKPPKKTYLTSAEAKRKFGELLHAPSGTFVHFEEGEGHWRPELSGGNLTGYAWFKTYKKAKRWRRAE